MAKPFEDVLIAISLKCCKTRNHMKPFFFCFVLLTELSGTVVSRLDYGAGGVDPGWG